MTPRYEPSVKARRWLRRQGLDFQEINLLKQPRRLKETLLDILPLLEGDSLGIIATRNKYYKPVEKRINEMSLYQLIDYLVAKPQLLKQPIIYDGNKVQVGFNPDDIRAFIPRQVRRLELTLIKEKIALEDSQLGGKLE